MSSDDESHPITPGPSGKSSNKEIKPKPTVTSTTSDIKKEPLVSERDIRHMERAYQQQQQELISMRKQMQDMILQRDADIARMHEMETRLHAVMVHKDDDDGHVSRHVVPVSSEPDNDGRGDDMHEHDGDIDDDGGSVPVVGNREPLELPKIPKSIKPYTGEGGASVRLWLQQFDTMRDPLGWSDRQSIAVCAMYLHDRAQQWYQEEGSRVAKKAKWKLFADALRKRFTPVVNQLFIPKYTRTLSQKLGEKSVDFMDRVRRELRDLGVDDEEMVVRVFASGLHDWITEPLTMVVGDDHKMSAKVLLDHCTRIELSKAIRQGTHFDRDQRNGTIKGDQGKRHPPTSHKPIHGYPKSGVVLEFNYLYLFTDR